MLEYLVVLDISQCGPRISETRSGEIFVDVCLALFYVAHSYGNNYVTAFCHFRGLFGKVDLGSARIPLGLWTRGPFVDESI